MTTRCLFRRASRGRPRARVWPCLGRGARNGRVRVGAASGRMARARGRNRGIVAAARGGCGGALSRLRMFRRRQPYCGASLPLLIAHCCHILFDYYYIPCPIHAVCLFVHPRPSCTILSLFPPPARSSGLGHSILPSSLYICVLRTSFVPYHTIPHQRLSPSPFVRPSIHPTLLHDPKPHYPTPLHLSSLSTPILYTQTNTHYSTQLSQLGKYQLVITLHTFIHSIRVHLDP